MIATIAEIAGRQLANHGDIIQFWFSNFGNF
jgi:hypothetical protein